METAQRRRISVVSSACLALLTLSVFYVARNKGPVSTVMRFHDALAKDPRSAGKYSIGGWGNPDFNGLAEFAYRNLKAGARIGIARTQRDPDDRHLVNVFVTYELGPRDFWTVKFVLQQSGVNWYIDPTRTQAG